MHVVVAIAFDERNIFGGVVLGVNEVVLQIGFSSRGLPFSEQGRSHLVLNVEGDEQEVIEAEVPSDCSPGEGRQLQDAAVGELNVPNETAAAGSRLQIYVDQLEDDAGIRQAKSYDHRRPSSLELQKPSLEVVKVGELAQKSCPNVARSKQCVRPIFQKVNALADVFFLLSFSSDRRGRHLQEDWL